MILDPELPPPTWQCELHQVNASTWLIRDRSIPTSDPAHLVAYITDAAGRGVDVLWFFPTELPTHYTSAGAVIDDVNGGTG